MLTLDNTSKQKVKRTLIILIGLAVAILLSLNYSGWQIAGIIFSTGHTAAYPDHPGSTLLISTEILSWENATNFLTSKILIIWQ